MKKTSHEDIIDSGTVEQRLVLMANHEFMSHLRSMVKQFDGLKEKPSQYILKDDDYKRLLNSLPKR